MVHPRDARFNLKGGARRHCFNRAHSAVKIRNLERCAQLVSTPKQQETGDKHQRANLAALGFGHVAQRLKQTLDKRRGQHPDQPLHDHDQPEGQNDGCHGYCDAAASAVAPVGDFR